MKPNIDTLLGALMLYVTSHHKSDEDEILKHLSPFDIPVTDKEGHAHTISFHGHYFWYTPSYMYFIHCDSPTLGLRMRSRFSEGMGFFSGMSAMRDKGDTNYGDELLMEVLGLAVAYVNEADKYDYLGVVAKRNDTVEREKYEEKKIRVMRRELVQYFVENPGMELEVEYDEHNYILRFSETTRGFGIIAADAYMLAFFCKETNKLLYMILLEKQGFPYDIWNNVRCTLRDYETGFEKNCAMGVISRALGIYTEDDMDCFMAKIAEAENETARLEKEVHNLRFALIDFFVGNPDAVLEVGDGAENAFILRFEECYLGPPIPGNDNLRFFITKKKPKQVLCTITTNKGLFIRKTSNIIFSCTWELAAFTEDDFRTKNFKQKKEIGILTKALRQAMPQGSVQK